MELLQHESERQCAMASQPGTSDGLSHQVLIHHGVFPHIQRGSSISSGSCLSEFDRHSWNIDEKHMSQQNVLKSTFSHKVEHLSKVQIEKCQCCQ